MNITYFRKSTHGLEKTIANVKKGATQAGWKTVATTQLPEHAGEIIMLEKLEFTEAIFRENHQLLGFLPVSVSVFRRDASVFIGTGQLEIIKALTQNGKTHELAQQADAQIKDVMHQAAGVEALKPQSVKLYSTTTCPYCTMEKEWLERHKVKHEVIYVDRNPQEAQYMVKQTGQMGVPVTEVTFADAEPEFVIGFDQQKLGAMLGVS